MALLGASGWGTVLALSTPAGSPNSEQATLGLMAAAGILGGTLHLCLLFLRQQSGAAAAGPGSSFGPWYFLFRPLIGAAGGLAACLAAAVVLSLLAAAPSAAEQVPLNPMAAAGLALAAGIWAESLLASIPHRGLPWAMQPEAEARIRYGINLTKAFNATRAPDDTRQRLAAHLGVRLRTIKAWEAQEPVPPHHQPLIAAFLNRHPRQIFTDIPAAVPVAATDPGDSA